MKRRSFFGTVLGGLVAATASKQQTKPSLRLDEVPVTRNEIIQRPLIYKPMIGGHYYPGDSFRITGKNFIEGNPANKEFTLAVRQE